MIWHNSPSVPVPATPLWAAVLLGIILGAFGVRLIRKGRPRAWGAAALVLAVLIPLSAWSVPYTFTNGTVANADQVNYDFSDLDARVTVLESRNIYVHGNNCYAQPTNPYVTMSGPDSPGDGLWYQNLSQPTTTLVTCPVVVHGNSITNLTIHIGTAAAFSCRVWLVSPSLGVSTSAPIQQAATPTFSDKAMNFGTFTSASMPVNVSCTISPNTGIRSLTWTEK
jgi:hypothetical protein